MMSRKKSDENLYESPMKCKKLFAQINVIQKEFSTATFQIPFENLPFCQLKLNKLKILIVCKLWHEYTSVGIDCTV